MTDSIDAGSDDEAIAGEHVGYVPCLDEAFPPDADDDSEAVDGSDAGYVADLTEAGDFADSDDGQAVAGSAVGFVAKPCCVDTPVTVTLDDFNRVEAIDWEDATPSGIPWTILNSGGTASVDGSLGIMTTGSGGLADATLELPVWPVTPGDDITLTTLVRYVDSQSPTGSHFRFIVDGVYTIECNEAPATVLIKTNGGATYTYSTSISLSSFFYIKIDISTVAFNVKAWQFGDAEPAGWMSGDPSASFEGFSVTYELREGAFSPGITCNVDWLELTTTECI